MINELVEILEELTTLPNSYYYITKNEHNTNYETPESYYGWDENIVERLKELDENKPLYHLVLYNSCVYDILANSYEELLEKVKKEIV